MRRKKHPAEEIVAKLRQVDTRLPPACVGGRHLATGTERLTAVHPACPRHTTDDARTSTLGHRIGAGQLSDSIRLLHR